MIYFSVVESYSAIYFAKQTYDYKYVEFSINIKHFIYINFYLKTTVKTSFTFILHFKSTIKMSSTSSVTSFTSFILHYKLAVCYSQIKTDIQTENYI